MKALQQTEQRIDWGEVIGFTKKIFRGLEDDLQEALKDLQTIKPALSVINHPVRIELWFMPKGMDPGELIDYPEDETYLLGHGNLRISVDLVSDQEKELRINLTRISVVVGELGSKYDLRTYGGWHIGTNKGHQTYEHQPGHYTFKPNYQKFRR